MYHRASAIVRRPLRLYSSPPEKVLVKKSRAALQFGDAPGTCQDLVLAGSLPELRILNYALLIGRMLSYAKSHMRTQHSSSKTGMSDAHRS